MMRQVYFVIVLIAVHLSSFSQDESFPAKSDSLPSGRPSPAYPRRISSKTFVLPAAMFTYGILSLNLPALKEFNGRVHDHTAGTIRTGAFQLESYLQWTPVIALYGLNAAGIRGHHDLPDRSGIYAIALVLQASIVYEVKKLGGETRPNGQGQLSFPSGHTSNAFAAAEVLRREYQGINPWYGAAGYAVAVATAGLRLYHNKHWFGDVVGGAAVGIFSADMAYLLYPKLKKLFSGSSKHSTLVFPVWQQGGPAVSLIRVF